MDDAELIRRCAGGDPLAQTELVKKHEAVVGRLLARLVGPGGDVQDLLQETFIRAFDGISSFRGDSSLSTWLCAIAVRTAMSARRKEKRRKAILAAWGRAGGLLGGAFGRASAGPAEGMERKHDAARFVYSVLERLPEKFRDVLVLHEMEGMSGREIAAVMHVRENTVWTRLHRARELFRERAGKMGFGEDAPARG